jgi:hypothetical protein
MTSAIRLRRLLAEEHPVVKGYDDEGLARPFTSERPVEPEARAPAS